MTIYHILGRTRSGVARVLELRAVNLADALRMAAQLLIDVRPV